MRIYDYTYDASENLLSSTYAVNNAFVNKTFYTYDALGNSTSQISQVFTNGSWVNAQKSEMEYDELTQTQRVDFIWDDMMNQWEETYKIVRTINSMGLIDTVKQYTSSEFAVTTCTFNSYNNIIQQAYSYYISGALNNSTLYSFIYEDFDDTDLSITSGDKGEIQLTLFPNPITNKINIKIDETFGNQEFEMSLTDINGRLLKTEKITKKFSTIHTANYAPGVYFINVTNKKTNANFSQKIIKN